MDTKERLLDANKVKEDFDNYNCGRGAVPAWTKTDMLLVNYENQYVSVIEVASSNKWLGEPHNSLMDKMWSIIVDVKKDFTNLPTFRSLLQAGLNLGITPVLKGKHKGKFGIRIYGMKKEPNQHLLKELLDFIFES
ncbi:MAG: hypothetical protein ACI4MQ_06100 [Candidatus Coproplasma sp.]